MIISASYKTDIPAFYGEWFLNRLNAGFCKVLNPYNRFASTINLTPTHVDGFIFWTKNAAPFLSHLSQIRDRDFPFIVQYTVNNYPRVLEFSVVDSKRSIEYMQRIADMYGQKTVVWRYDPIVFSSVTSLDFHRANFEQIAKSLEGKTDEVVISFAQIYKKTLHNMNWASRKFDFEWEDPCDEIKYHLASELALVAQSYNMQLKVCSQKKYLSANVEEARCIDAARLSEISNSPVRAKIKGNRTECGCFESKDIGDYDTCPHGCVYCYAVRNRELAQKRYKQHDPLGEFLFTPDTPFTDAPSGESLIQLSLF